MEPARTFIFRKRVTYSECTVGNHVYYARYLDYLEEARGEFFRMIGFPLLQLQLEETIFPVIECSLKYLRPARYDDTLEIALWIGALSHVRLRFDYEISRNGQALVSGMTEHVCTSAAEKPKRMPEGLRMQLEKYLVRSDPES